MTAGDVHAVITAFRPDGILIDAIEALHEQVASITVVDDGSGADAGLMLEAAARAGAQVLRLPENGGIAAALNAGLDTALAAGADSIVTFDQDSVVPPGFVSALVRTRDEARGRGRSFGPVVPEYFAGVRQVHRVDPDGTLVARRAIQSGMLLERGLLEDVGQLRVDLFIDLVDTEFELRCTAAGYPAIAAPGLRLEHSLGRRYERRIFGLRVRVPGIPPVVTLSTPFRYYYRVRNRRVINRLHRRTSRGWIVRDSIFDAIQFVDALTLARPRRSLWRLYRAGWRDAGRGRMGRMPDELLGLAHDIRWDARDVE